MIAFDTAKMVKLFSDTSPGSADSRIADGARAVKAFILRWINTMPVKKLIDALPCHVMILGNANTGVKLFGESVHYVNLLFSRESFHGKRSFLRVD
jgi:hypothetical protein